MPLTPSSLSLDGGTGGLEGIKTLIILKSSDNPQPADFKCLIGPQGEKTQCAYRVKYKHTQAHAVALNTGIVAGRKVTHLSCTITVIRCRAYSTMFENGLCIIRLFILISICSCCDMIDLSFTLYFHEH